MRLYMFAVVLGVAVLGCGGGTDRSPQEQCEDLLDVIFRDFCIGK